MSTIQETEHPIYAPHGSENFNREMHEVLADLTEEAVGLIGDNLVALLLGGGYGRGEGAVYLIDGQEKPFNDLDLTIVVQRRNRALKKALLHIKHRYEHRLGIHVDFSRPITLSELRHLPHWLMWHDLLSGHKTLYGPAYILSVNMPSYMSQPVPGTEALRLLLNRGAGLLMALRIERGCQPSPDPEFVRRNYYKAALALGDAVLIMLGRYEGNHRRRHERLIESVESDKELQKLDLIGYHEDGVNYKFEPHNFADRAINEDDLRQLASRWRDVLLWCERQRTGGPFEDIEVYSRWPGIREKEYNRLRHIPKNLVRNLRVGWLSLRHPRESLYRQLPQLLDIQQMDFPEWPDVGKEFLKAWERYN